MPRGEATGKTWIAVDTDLFNHPRFAPESGLTRGDLTTTYLALIAYSRRHLSDGIVVDSAAEEIAERALSGRKHRTVATTKRNKTGDNAPAIRPQPADEPRNQAEPPPRAGGKTTNNALAILRARGALKRRKGAYIIPDYADWQQTREAANALHQRQSKAGKASARKRTTGSTTGSTSGSTTRSTEQRREELNNQKPLEKATGRARATATSAGIENTSDEPSQPPATLTPAELANTAIRTDTVGRLLAVIGTDADTRTERAITRLANQHNLSEAELEQTREAILESTGVDNRAGYAVATIRRLVAERQI